MPGEEAQTARYYLRLRVRPRLRTAPRRSDANLASDREARKRLGFVVGRRSQSSRGNLTKDGVELRAKKYDGVALRLSEQTREVIAKKRMAELKMKLVTGPVLQLPLSKPNVEFNPSNLVPLHPLGTVYPTARIVDEWGVLSVTQDVLLDAHRKLASVSAPTETSGTVLHGHDWTLELNPGWSISAGERPGDFRLEK